MLPNTTYLVTRRCSERRVFLHPSRGTSEIFLYVLAVAARRYDVLIHAAAQRVKLVDDVKLPADARRALRQARAARARLAEESKKAQDSTAKAVRTLLKGMHSSVRDAGELIGISPQRVHQLAHENG